MNDPHAYYLDCTNRYDFRAWCIDYHINPLEIYGAEGGEAVDIAARMVHHNHLEDKWQREQSARAPRPRPFTAALVCALAMLAGMLSVFAPVVLAAL